MDHWQQPQNYLCSRLLGDILAGVCWGVSWNAEKGLQRENRPWIDCLEWFLQENPCFWRAIQLRDLEMGIEVGEESEEG